MSLQFNRHQEDRALAKAHRIIKGWRIEKPADRERIAHRIKNNRKPCSCSMCCNPRKEYGDITMQERRHEDSTKEQLKNNE